MYSDEQMLESLKEILAIPSVAYVDVTEKEPFGRPVAEALDYILKLCERLGMRITNRNGQVAWAEIGEGDEMIAVVPHVDVVPAGEGWSVEPFACTEKDGKLYGRGSSDNKGPAIACVYAAADLLAEGRKFPRRIRLIFGQCEETGKWGDMEYYRNHEEQPVSGFTPDAEFPALCGEKGMLWLELTAPLSKSGFTLLEGGSATNMVAASCRAAYLGKDGSEITVEAQGRAVHATVPEKGENAIGKVMDQLAQVPELDSPFVRFYQTYIGSAFHGENLGIFFQDDISGCTTTCVGMARTENDTVRMSLDVRYPVTADGSAILSNIRKAADACGLSINILKDEGPMYRDPKDPKLAKLLEAYREETGDMSDPLVIGGGTYARAVDNICGFGAAFPGRVHTEHQKDEYVMKEDFFRSRRIYRSALNKLLDM